MFQLDPAFTGRIANNAQPPLLKLSFGASPTPTAKVRLFYNRRPAPEV
jgi:hypothetical protein